MFSKDYWFSMVKGSVSVVTAFVLVVGVFPASTFASHNDVDPFATVSNLSSLTCGVQSITFTGSWSADKNDNNQDGDSDVEFRLVVELDNVEILTVNNDNDENSDNWSKTVQNVSVGSHSITASIESRTRHKSGSKGKSSTWSNWSQWSTTVSGDTDEFTITSCEPAPKVTLSGTASCLASDGSWSVTWTVSHNQSHKEMDIEDVDTLVTTKSNPDWWDWSITTSPVFAPNPVAAGNGQSATAISQHSSSIKKVNVEVEVDWDGYNGNQDEDLTINKPTTPCAPPPPACDPDEELVNGQCVEIPKVTICHVTGSSWNEISVDANGWNGHGSHEDDFLVDAQHPCQPTEEPETPEECPQGQHLENEICVDDEQTQCDEGMTGIYPDCVADQDNDTVPDESDNCIATANTDQLDTDEDGTGDVCDETPNGDEQTPPSNPNPSNGGGSTGGGKGHTNKVCSDNVDNDNDGLYDSNDPGCENPMDGSEEDPVGGNPEGDVLGAACGPILNSFLGLRGKANDPEAVKVVQEFLNKELGLSLEVNGEYDAATIEAVKAFQSKYSTDVLGPWGIGDATGIVYLTTQRMINKISCPSLDIPMPELE